MPWYLYHDPEEVLKLSQMSELTFSLFQIINFKYESTQIHSLYQPGL